MTQDLLHRLPERVGKITVDLTTVYPRRKDAPASCEVEVMRVPTMSELYGARNKKESKTCEEK
jgi:hypothetical protein